ncbi:MAG: DNA polymerase III subunit delta' [Bacteroidota bacterium]
MPSDSLWPAVIGQHRVKELLRRSFEAHRIPHAYLFTGSDGVGKDVMAIELARTINCEHLDRAPCGTCGSCIKMASLQHPNLSLVFALPTGKSGSETPLGGLSTAEIETIQKQLRLKAENLYYDIQIPKANEIRVASIRELRTNVAYSPFASGMKCVIIIDAERMNEEASNALLKTLEEPTPRTVIILTSAHPEKLLLTILSRCQLVRFDPLTESDIAAALVERMGVDLAQSRLVARLAHGSYSQAVDLLGTDVQRHRTQAVNFIRTAFINSPTAMTAFIDEVLAGSDRPGAEEWLSILQLWLRDAMLLREVGEEAILNVDQREDLLSFSSRFPHADITMAIGLVDRSIALVRKNVYLPLIFVCLAIALRSTLLRK